MPKRQKTKICVVDDAGNSRSLPWTIITRGSDVFVGAGSLGQHKLTLHASGICRWAFTAEYWTEEISRAVNKTNRALDRWERPKTPAVGHVLVQSILLPGHPQNVPILLETYDGSADRILPAAAFNEAWEVLLLFCKSAPEDVSFDGIDLIAVHTLSNGEYLYVIAQLHPFELSSLKIPPAQGGLLPGANAPAADTVRGVVIAERKDGVRIAIDLPVVRTPAAPAVSGAS
jgi:hypothetical protein